MRGLIFAGAVSAAAALSGIACVATPIDQQEDNGRPLSADLGDDAATRGKCGAEGDCKEGFYCARDLGTCGSKGACQPMPESCLDMYDPVCGCDGVTYSNACYAAMMGSAVSRAGACEVACATNADCGEGYCRKKPGACGERGVCRARPEACTFEYNPVCGCDGTTYANACAAASSAASVGSTGECQ